MTGDNMKSELLIESRYRTDGRQGLAARRRMSSMKNSHLIANGDYEADLTLAIEASLRCSSRQASDSADGEEVHHHDSRSNGSLVSDERREPCVDGKLCCSDLTQESRKLKELLLLHIDLIHHQQDLIVQKDREISALKSEKEALKCRLERMERRMALLKQKEDLLESQHLPKSQGSELQAQQHSERGYKRKSSLEHPHLQKRASVEGVRSKQDRVQLKSRQHSLRGGSDLHIRNRSDGADSILRTDNFYYVSYYEPPPLVEKVELKVNRTSDKLQDEVEIPTWRIRTLTNCYTLEGTENLEDEVFIKRHQKPELEEKRRKRWDLQRLREQKMYEKLRERERNADPLSKDEDHTITSFYPSLDDITHIEVADKVPVTAFGHPIPYIKPTDFELPWELSQWPSISCSEENRPKPRWQKRK